MSKIIAGGFPEAHALSERPRNKWFSGYIDAITTRDIREMARVREPSQARTILNCLAASTGQELNTTTLSNRSTISRKTVDRYVELLDAMFMTHRLPALHNNVLTRASKHKKVYLTDTGLAGYLLAESIESLAQPVAPSLGPLCETFMVNEIAKQATWAQHELHLHHYREYSGPEVDLVIRRPNNTIVGLESKASTTVGAGDFSGLKTLANRLGSKFVHGYVTYLGTEVRPFGPTMTAIPLSSLWAAL